MTCTLTVVSIHKTSSNFWYGAPASNSMVAWYHKEAVRVVGAWHLHLLASQSLAALSKVQRDAVQQPLSCNNGGRDVLQCA